MMTFEHACMLDKSAKFRRLAGQCEQGVVHLKSRPRQRMRGSPARELRRCCFTHRAPLAPCKSARNTTLLPAPQITNSRPEAKTSNKHESTTLNFWHLVERPMRSEATYRCLILVSRFAFSRVTFEGHILAIRHTPGPRERCGQTRAGAARGDKLAAWSAKDTARMSKVVGATHQRIQTP